MTTPRVTPKMIATGQKWRNAMHNIDILDAIPNWRTPSFNVMLDGKIKQRSARWVCDQINYGAMVDITDLDYLTRRDTVFATFRELTAAHYNPTLRSRILATAFDEAQAALDRPYRAHVRS